MSLSTHVLDAGKGRPAAGVPVQLFGEGRLLAAATTDDDGRVVGLATSLEPGVYRLVFDLTTYDTDGFFPEASIAFRVSDKRHHHIPLLLSPFAYSTYRGS